MPAFEARPNSKYSFSENKGFPIVSDLKPDEYLRNKTVVQEWRKVVVGGPWDIKHMMAGQ